MVYILVLTVKRTGTVNICHYSWMLFRVAFICLDTFSEPCDQGMCNFTNHCSIIYMSCSNEKSPK